MKGKMFSRHFVGAQVFDRSYFKRFPIEIRAI